MSDEWHKSNGFQYGLLAPVIPIIHKEFEVTLKGFSFELGEGRPSVGPYKIPDFQMPDFPQSLQEETQKAIASAARHFYQNQMWLNRQLEFVDWLADNEWSGLMELVTGNESNREIAKKYEDLLNDISQKVEEMAKETYAFLGEGFRLPRYSVPASSADEILKAIAGLRKRIEETQEQAEKDFFAEAYKGLEPLEPMFGFMPLNSHFAIGEGGDGFVVWPVATSSGRKRGRWAVSKYKVELAKSLPTGRGRKFAKAVIKRAL